MPQITIAVIEIDYNVSFPTISFDVKFVVPDGIPVLGGKTYELGSGSISLQNPSLDFPVSLGPVSGDLNFSLDTAHCEFCVGGSISLDVLVHTYHWNIGPGCVQYMTPFSLPEPSWSVNPVILDAAALQAAIDATPVGQFTNDSGVNTLRNDSATQALIEGFFVFSGAGAFVEQMLACAEKLEQNYSAQLAKAAPGAGPTDQSVLISLGIGGTAALIKGVGVGTGIFFTSRGDFGTFGTTVDVIGGICVELSAGLAIQVYFPDAGQSALQCFQGYNIFVIIDAGDAISASVAFYWPADNPYHASSTTVCGIGVGLGPGVGLPVNFMIGNSDTVVNKIHFPTQQCRPDATKA